MRNRFMQIPFFGTALDRFVPIHSIQLGEKLGLDSTHLAQIVGESLGIKDFVYSIHYYILRL